MVNDNICTMQNLEWILKVYLLKSKYWRSLNFCVHIFTFGKYLAIKFCLLGWNKWLQIHIKYEQQHSCPLLVRVHKIKAVLTSLTFCRNIACNDTMAVMDWKSYSTFLDLRNVFVLALPLQFILCFTISVYFFSLVWTLWHILF